MGDVHKFKRPPRNRQQFQGYRPEVSKGTSDGKPARRPLRDWQRSAIIWFSLFATAAAFWAISAWIGSL
jgi:hypothetical protein